VRLVKCTLHAKLNGKMTVETRADKLHGLAQAVRQEVSVCESKHCRVVSTRSRLVVVVAVAMEALLFILL
jgi:hypothetical protein